MILKILIGIAVLIAALLLFAATKPATFHIERSLAISASPGKMFALLDDFHNWSQWAPDEKGNSAIRRTYSGSISGAGAVSDWEGSGSAGKGRMTILESTSPSRIIVQVNWVKPFRARNINQFVLSPEGTNTKVTWSMEGPNLYVMKLMSVFVNMDKQMGSHFEAGLANLKTAAER